MKRLVLLLAALLAQPSRSACIKDRYGDTVCPQPDARCLADRYGDILCSSPGGGIEKDRYGDVVCAPGHFVADLRGEVWCSKLPRGAAAQDRYGNATCSGECVAAKAQACVRPAGK
jgi:hypothetical protein